MSRPELEGHSHAKAHSRTRSNSYIDRGGRGSSRHQWTLDTGNNRFGKSPLLNSRNTIASLQRNSKGWAKLKKRL